MNQNKQFLKAVQNERGKEGVIDEDCSIAITSHGSKQMLPPS